MSKEINKILETIETHNEYERKLTEALETQLPEYLMSLVDGYHSFRISASIPSFNDGEPCVFSVDYPSFKCDDNTEGTSEEDYDQWNDESYMDYYSYNGKLEKKFKKITNLIQAIPSDFFNKVYGDYFQLIVTKDEVQVNTDYYPE